jgi:hypothetical protein
LNERSPLRRFIVVRRRFGLAVAARVAYSRVRGILFPSLALPDQPPYNAAHRELSVLLDAKEHSVTDLNEAVAALAGRSGWGWEICIRAYTSADREMAGALARLRGSNPWIRVVQSDETVDHATAAQRTLEQATGQFVALVAPGCRLQPEVMGGLLARLRNGPGNTAAVVAGTAQQPGGGPRQRLSAECCLLLLSKADHLAVGPVPWLLTARSVAEHLAQAGAATVHIDGFECGVAS